MVLSTNFVGGSEIVESDSQNLAEIRFFLSLSAEETLQCFLWLYKTTRED